MFLLQTQSLEQATGKVAEIYATVPKEVGIPAPMRLMSASPGLLGCFSAIFGYYMSHPRLSFPLLAAIRYLSAIKTGHEFCTEFNGGMLLKMGMTAGDLAGLSADPKTSNLEADEAAMLAFVAKALDNPGAVTAADVEALRAHGYADSDIYDAVYHGANMFGASVVYKTFVRE